MTIEPQPADYQMERVDQIPVIWVEPQKLEPLPQLIICLPGLSYTKELLIPLLQFFANEGFIALCFDPWLHGERGTETQEEIIERVFSNFQRNMWPIIGQTTLDVLRIMDWALEKFEVDPEVRICGISMGGDTAVAAAGIDHRIHRVAALIATPDWLRPGMEDIFNPGKLLPLGKPDAYANYFYEQLNPLTHLDRFVNGSFINFICGEKDTHVPYDNALRFQSALCEAYPEAEDRIEVNIIPDLGHMDFVDPTHWLSDSLAWLKRD